MGNDNQIVIESPKLEDVDTLFRWGDETRYLWSHPATKWFSKKTLRKWIVDPREDVLLVARASGKLVGMCFVDMLRDWAYCSGLYVDEHVRKQGVGRMLLAEAERRLKEKGLSGLELDAVEDNIEAQKFYESCGFTKGFKMQWMYKAFEKEDL